MAFPVAFAESASVKFKKHCSWIKAVTNIHSIGANDTENLGVMLLVTAKEDEVCK